MTRDLERPVIDVTDRPLDTLTTAAIAALHESNEPPRIFEGAHGELVRLRFGATGARIEVLTRAALRGLLARAATWRERKMRGGQAKQVSTFPPAEVVADVAELAAWPFPTIDGISPCAVLGLDGAVHMGPGYDAAVRLWITDDGIDVPTDPTTRQRDEARSMIVDELLGDFPFVSDADRANAVALVLLPFVRPAITGPTPLHLLEAPTEGTGKGLLADVALGVALNRSPAVYALGRGEDETRKLITGLLVEGAAAILLDNVERLDSTALAAALTSENWTDRLLGSTRTLEMPARAIWVATGNNPTLSGELARRSIRIRLDAACENPHERAGWSHPNLAEWARDHRPELARAALTLVTAWTSTGSPLGTVRLGRYETWAATLSGILEHAGITGLNANAAELRRSNVNAAAAWRELAELWWQQHGSGPVAVSALWKIAEGLDGLGITASSDRAARTSFGMRLSQQRDRRIGPWRVERVGVDHSAALYRLVPTGEPAAAEGSPLFDQAVAEGSPGSQGSPNSPDRGTSGAPSDEVPREVPHTNGQATHPNGEPREPYEPSTNPHVHAGARNQRAATTSPGSPR